MNELINIRRVWSGTDPVKIDENFYIEKILAKNRLVTDIDFVKKIYVYISDDKFSYVKEINNIRELFIIRSISVAWWQI